MTVRMFFTAPAWSALRRLNPIVIPESCEFVIVIGSLLVSLILEDWSWFQRSGSVMVLMGVFDLPRGHPHVKVKTISVIGGTLIWAYGDLLRLLF